MSRTGEAELGRTRRELPIRRARLVSGLVLFTFVTLHLANHALGLVSLEAMEAGRRAFLAMWRNPVGTLVFYTALLTHFLLALLSLYRRRSLKMPVREALQLTLGLLLPVLIAQHVIGTRLHHELTGYRDTYLAIVGILWVFSPDKGAWQALALVVAWGHGCLGLYFWLRYRPWYPRWMLPLFAAAVLLPTLSLLGFAAAGRIAASLPADAFASEVPQDTLIAAARLERRIEYGFYVLFAAALGAVFGLRALRAARTRHQLVEITYPGGRRLRVPPGFSVLEASRMGGIPHHSVCGGRGRCSTCRVRVTAGLESLPPPSVQEHATLSRIGAHRDVRLACQIRPTHSISVVPLLSPAPAERDAFASPAAGRGREREIAVLFCDIRNFTGISEHRLPFDVVFLLNRYFASVGVAVERAGGRMDKFIGDGAMALFGLHSEPAEACREALAAARDIAGEMSALNEELAAELSEPLRVAIGLHAGPAIVGAIGYGSAVPVTAVGDTVNVASRLEALAKELDVQLVVSRRLASLADADLSAFQEREIAIRGRADPLLVRLVPDATRIPAAAADAAQPPQSSLSRTAAS